MPQPMLRHRPGYLVAFITMTKRADGNPGRYSASDLPLGVNQMTRAPATK